MDNLKFVVVALIGLLACSVSGAADIREYRATEVRSEGNGPTLFSHESVLFGLSCSSGPIGKLSDIKTVSVGDEIRYEDKAFRVGLIKVTEFNEDMKWGGNTIGEKGDVVCVAAEDEPALPSGDDCDALWLRIPTCRPIR